MLTVQCSLKSVTDLRAVYVKSSVSKEISLQVQGSEFDMQKLYEKMQGMVTLERRHVALRRAGQVSLAYLKSTQSLGNISMKENKSGPGPAT